jgi:cytochrome b6-f complex iron-sulfur subunit
MNRKSFLCLTCMAAAGCQSTGNNGSNSGSASVGVRGERTVDAGPSGAYAADGLYEGFRNQGFFLVRSGGRLFALSSICTHRVSKLDVQPDHSFHCPSHGSNFDPNGKVTHGPAVRDLPVFPVHTDERGHVMVKVVV